MNAYLEGRLDLKARRRMARHLDECLLCYAEYVRQRELVDELSRRVALVGQPQAGQLQKLWSSIQADMCLPKPKRRYQRRYGLVALMLSLVTLFPWTLGNQNVPFSVPSQPVPSSAATQSPRMTDSRPVKDSPVTVALVMTDGQEQTPRVALWNTPEPRSAQ